MADNFNNKRISALSLVGRDRYEQYAQELFAQGTIGGERLSPAERKEGFKRRNNKVQFKTFVERVLQKKAVAAAKVKPIRTRVLPGTAERERGGALTKFIPQPEAQKSSFSILKVLNSILDTLKNQFKFDKKKEDDDRKEEERERRSKRESALESVKKIGKGIVDKVVAPFKSIFDRIWNFILYTFLGRAFTKLMEWLKDPKNKKKVFTLVRFFKDWWPSILVGALAFFTPLGSLIATITGTIIASIARIAAVNPLLAAAIATVGGTFKLVSDAKGANQRAVDEARKKKGSTLTPAEEAEAVTQKMTNPLMGGFIIPTLVDQQLSQPSIPKKDIGGLISSNTGVKISGAGADTQLTALQPGEVVMNRSTVNAVGAHNLLGLNRMFGGPNANKPVFSNNIRLAQGGGIIGSIGRFLSSSGRVMAPRGEQFSGQQTTVQKIFGMTVPGSERFTTYSPDDIERYNRAKPTRPLVTGSKLYISPDGYSQYSAPTTRTQSRTDAAAPVSPERRREKALTEAIQLNRDLERTLRNVPGAGGYVDILKQSGDLGEQELRNQLEMERKIKILGPQSRVLPPGPPQRGRSSIINLPPIAQTASAAGMAPAAGTQIPSFPAVSASGGSDRATNASIYGIV